MTSFGKIVASMAFGIVVGAAGSAFALVGLASTPTLPTVNIPWQNAAAVPHTQGFSHAVGWNCAPSGNGGSDTLSFRDRWNGSWEFASNDFTSFTWASCQNHWAYGYINVPRSQPAGNPPRTS